MTKYNKLEWGRYYRKTPKGMLTNFHSKMKDRTKIKKMQKWISI